MKKFRLAWLNLRKEEIQQGIRAFAEILQSKGDSIISNHFNELVISDREFNQMVKFRVGRDILKIKHKEKQLTY